MELIKTNWKKTDIKQFQNYLKLFERPEKVEWAKNILNTNLPVLAALTKNITDIVNQLKKGNYLEFLDLNINEYYENVGINGSLLCCIEDFNTLEKYLTNYANAADCWAACDILKFKITKADEQKFIKLAHKYLKDVKPFVRRIGFVILFHFVNDKNYTDMLFNACNDMFNETHYYVNMINAWLVAECFARHREETLKFLNNHKLNKFTINKAISKCRDSFRISKEDKEMLLSYKVK